MASGTGNLPNDNMVFTPYDVLTAEEQNQLVENIEALADGSGIGDEAVTTPKIADDAVTPEKRSGGFHYSPTDAKAGSTDTTDTMLTGGEIEVTVAKDNTIILLEWVGGVTMSAGGSPVSAHIALWEDSVGGTEINRETVQLNTGNASQFITPVRAVITKNIGTYKFYVSHRRNPSGTSTNTGTSAGLLTAQLF